MNARRGKKREARRIRRGRRRRRRRDSKFRITPTAATHLFLSLLLRVCVCQMIGSQLTIQEDVAIMYHKSQHTYTHTHTTQRNATDKREETRKRGRRRRRRRDSSAERVSSQHVLFYPYSLQFGYCAIQNRTATGLYSRAT